MEACKVLGLEGPAKSASAAGALLDHLKYLLIEYAGLNEVEALNKYPHSKLVKVEREKKQSSRMHKLICRKNDTHPETDIVIRASKKVTSLGIPYCYCSAEFVVEEEKGEDS